MMTSISSNSTKPALLSIHCGHSDRDLISFSVAYVTNTSKTGKIYGCIHCPEDFSSTVRMFLLSPISRKAWCFSFSITGQCGSSSGWKFSTMNEQKLPTTLSWIHNNYKSLFYHWVLEYIYRGHWSFIRLFSLLPLIHFLNFAFLPGHWSQSSCSFLHESNRFHQFL